MSVINLFLSAQHLTVSDLLLNTSLAFKEILFNLSSKSLAVVGHSSSSFKTFRTFSKINLRWYIALKSSAVDLTFVLVKPSLNNFFKELIFISIFCFSRYNCTVSSVISLFSLYKPIIAL